MKRKSESPALASAFVALMQTSSQTLCDSISMAARLWRMSNDEPSGGPEGLSNAQTEQRSSWVSIQHAEADERLPDIAK